MHSTLKKTLKWSVIVLASVAIGIPLLLAAINAVDQNLKPEAIAFADFLDDEVPEQDNGYFAWVGLSAPANEKPHAVGTATVALINQRLASHSLETIVDPASLLGPNALKFKGGVSGLCGRDSNNCLARYQAKETDIKKWLIENQIFLERYRGLYAYPQFRETIRPHLRTPTIYEPSLVAGLARAQHALTAIHGNPQTALRQLRDDTNYWRSILQQSRSLISRMIAVAAIQGNTQLISEIIASISIDPQTLAVASQASQPLTVSERDLSKVFRYEFGFTMDVFSNISQYKNDPCPSDSWTDCLSGTLMSTFLFKPNATINLSYERLARMARLASLPAQEWNTRIRARREERDRDNMLFVWHIFYNPVGKILDAIAKPAYESYSGRIHNLDGFLRLVSLQTAVKRAGILDSAVEKFLVDTAPEQRNPYTGEAMQWDAGSRVIYFNGYNEKADGDLLSKRIEVRL